MLLQGGVLIEVGAGDGAGVQGPGVAPGLLLLPGHLGHVSNQAKTGLELILFYSARVLIAVVRGATITIM